jgi:ABC-2 type transport system ATP-binding protein
MISLKKLSFGYRNDKLLFQNLNLELEPGHIYGLLGKNGEGKSSLLRNIAGLLFPKSGIIDVLGYAPQSRNAQFLQEIFFIPEEVYLPPISIKQFAKYYGALYPKFNTNRFFEILSELEIPTNRNLDNLSFGQKKKTTIAFALSSNTKIVLMDEPTNGLDIPSKNQFRKLILSDLSEDKIFLISTHQIKDLDNLIDSVIILNDGKIAIQESLENICKRIEFSTLSEQGINDKVISKQSFMGGFKVLRENIFGAESSLDLEHFFNAVIEYPDKIKSIFE